MSLLLIGIIPIMVLCMTSNLIFRAPDLYQNEFMSTDIVNNSNINMTAEELGEFFSRYMLGISDEFQIVPDPEMSQDKLFTEGEQLAMQQFAKILNIQLIIGAVLLVITVLLYLYFLRKRWPEILRKRFFGACIFFTLMIISSILVYNIQDASEFLYNLIFTYDPGETDLLPQLLGRHFAKSSLVAGNMVAAVVMVVIYYLTWRLTKPRRMFW